MKNLLIVDDNKTSLSTAKSVLNKYYKVTPVTSGQQALKFLERCSCDMILLDINMPEMDGFETLKHIRDMENGKNVPIIFLTADNDPETESRCLREGASDFISKPFVPDIMYSRISRILELEDLRKNLEEKLEERTNHIQHIQQMLVIGMASMVELRDGNTGGHIRRTSNLVQIFSDELIKTGSFTKSFLDMVVRAAPLHDLGKIAIDDRVLRKAGRFTDAEYSEMKRHSEEGAKIVKKLLDGVEEETFVKIAVNVAHYHHEKWNGGGYPEGLSGTDIPIEARIMALADVFDALVSKRCYKEAYSYDRAFSIIEESLGSHFDPELGKLFLECKPELIAFFEQQQDEEVS